MHHSLTTANCQGHKMRTRKNLFNFLILSLLISILSCDDKPITPDISYCKNPVDLNGQFDPKAPGYIVVFNDNIDAKEEVERLKSIYALQVSHIYDSALNGFSASMSDDTREKLRCEKTIKYIQYDQSISLSTE